jgi:NAD(P)-dependent dehydrogenase (short-subunit alcohol dehydrogenase family)
MDKLFSLKHKIAVVTGALGLIGKNHCLALNNAGASVVVADLDEQKCIDFANKYLHNSTGVYLDVTKKESVINLMDKVLSIYQKIDILINNAAINDMFEDPKVATEQSKFENYPIELWQRSIDVNLTGVFLCSQVIGSEMVRQKSGSIINIASTYGITAPDQSIYIDEFGNQSFFKPPAYSILKEELSC